MYDLTLLSIFRNSTSYLDRYLSQIAEVRTHLDSLHLIWLEGDSADDTNARLTAATETLDADVTLVTFPTGGPHWPSIDHPARWYQLEACWNKALSYLEPSRWCVCVESDLIWDWSVLDKLLEHVRQGRCEVACPMLMSYREPIGEYFYDTNAFRVNGQHFSNSPPYHPMLSQGKQLVNLETAGGLLVADYNTMKDAVWRDKCVLHYPVGTHIMLDTQLRIYHP